MIPRRQFISLLGGAAAAWPVAARAQQEPERVRRVGVLVNLGVTDPEAQARLAAFEQALDKLAWKNGHNLRLDYRAGSDLVRMQAQAVELVALPADVILATGTVTLRALRQATDKTPIVFVNVSDPVRAGFVSNLSRPSGNVTGFTAFEFSMSGKWLELLKDIAPQTGKVMIIFDPENPTSKTHIETLESVAPSVGIKLTLAPVTNPADVERAINTIATQANGAMIVLPGPVTNVNRQLIALLAARHSVPAVYAYRFNVASGGLMSYGVDTLDLFRRAASYVDRILRGEHPGHLPVQQPVRFELVLNVRAAKAIGLEIPPILLARADEVIE